MNRHLRHDRSPLLCASLGESPTVARRRRCLSIVSLRFARNSYHLLADTGAIGETVGEQLRWKLRKLAAGIGLRLVISGAPPESSGFAEIN